jgi:hypothetical protein
MNLLSQGDWALGSFHFPEILEEKKKINLHKFM